MHLTVRTPKGYIQAISGLFISHECPGGLTPKEIEILTAFLFVMKSNLDVSIDVVIKTKVSSLTSHPAQVVTNYVKKLRDKKAITGENRLHPILRSYETVIKYKEQNNMQSGSNV